MIRSARVAAVFAAILVLGVNGPAAEEKPKPRPKNVTGELTKVETAAISVTVRGDSGERTAAFALDVKTKIMIETDENETVKVKGEGGEKEVTRPKLKTGTPADLKTGQRVTVTSLDEKAASEILVRRIAKSKEGDKK